MKIFNKNRIIAYFFLLIMYCFFIINFKGVVKTTYNTLIKTKNLQEAGKQIEESYRTSFKNRDYFIDIYGLVQLAFNKSMIGNFEFIKDKQGYIHMLNQNLDSKLFNEEIIKLDNLLENKNIPLLYVQVPLRNIENYTKYTSDISQNENEVINEVINNLKENRIKFLDIRNNIKNKEYPAEDVYFKTDLHMNTQTELWLLQKLILTLENDFNLGFSNKDQIFNLDNYNIISKKMLGNLGRSTGKYYVGLDSFELLFPNFSTEFKISNYSNNSTKVGEFWNTIMNGYDSNSNDYRTYWVTDYLQWPSPYYNIENKNVQNNNILIIMDSLGLRTAAYLSLLCNNVTVLDSRYFNGINYVEKALDNQKYDAVIILQSTNLLFSKLLPNDLEAHIISDNTPLYIKRDEKYLINITVKNDGDLIWNNANQIRLCIWQDGIDYGYRINIPEDVNINPGEEYTFVLQNFQAPPGNSTYLEYQMVQEGIAYFGDKKRVDIAVEN